MRIGLASDVFRSLGSIWGDSSIRMALKIRLFKAAVIAVLAHGAEA